MDLNTIVSREFLKSKGYGYSQFERLYYKEYRGENSVIIHKIFTEKIHNLTLGTLIAELKGLGALEFKDL